MFSLCSFSWLQYWTHPTASSLLAPRRLGCQLKDIFPSLSQTFLEDFSASPFPLSSFLISPPTNWRVVLFCRLFLLPVQKYSPNQADHREKQWSQISLIVFIWSCREITSWLLCYILPFYFYMSPNSNWDNRGLFLWATRTDKCVMDGHKCKHHWRLFFYVMSKSLHI